MSKLQAGVSHHQREVAELRADLELAIEYLKLARESVNDPSQRAGGLLSLRAIAEAYGGFDAIAAEVGLSQEALTTALSPEGNLPQPTLLAIMQAVESRMPIGSAFPSQA